MMTLTIALKTKFPWLFKGRLKSVHNCSSHDCGQDSNFRQRLWRTVPTVQLHGSAFCFPECLERELRRRLQPSTAAQRRASVTSCRVPLGLLMLSRGELTSDQLQEALEAQKKTGTGRIGEWLQQLGYARDITVAAALASQWSCPVVKSIPATVGNCTIPFYLLKTFAMAPVHFSSDRLMLHMAFADKIEHRALFAIEQMMKCKTEACLTTRAEIDAALTRIEEHDAGSEKLFEGISDPEERTRIISSYVSTLHAAEVRVAACGETVMGAHHGRNVLRKFIVLAYRGQSSSIYK